MKFVTHKYTFNKKASRKQFLNLLFDGLDLTLDWT